MMPPSCIKYYLLHTYMETKYKTKFWGHHIQNTILQFRTPVSNMTIEYNLIQPNMKPDQNHKNIKSHFEI